MNGAANSFPLNNPFSRLIFLIVVLALPALAQTRPDSFQKVALKTPPCMVGTVGELTALVKDGVELSVNEDFDCDGVPDAYDNCVGMPNASQADSDGNGIGDVCEAAVMVKTGEPAKSIPNTKLKTPKPSPAKTRSKPKINSSRSKAADKPSPRAAKKRRGR